MNRFVYIKCFFIMLVVSLSTLVSARDKEITITINSEPTGAKVFVDGKNVGTTPCKVSFKGKWVYDIDAKIVQNPDRPPYSKKITFIKDGYEPATEYWEGTYEYHESGLGGRMKYYIVKPKGYDVMAFLKKDQSYSTSNNSTTSPQNAPSANSPIKNEDELILQCNIDSEPSDARIFWKISSRDRSVKSTDEQYLGKTPFKENKSFRIVGLEKKNAEKVKIELFIKKKGYREVKKEYSALDLMNLLEFNGFFEMKEEEKE